MLPSHPELTLVGGKMCPFSPASFHIVGKGGKDGEQEMTQGSREKRYTVFIIKQEALKEVGDVVLEGWGW